MSTEIWKPILGYETYYEISNKGRIRGLGNCKAPCKYKGKTTYLSLKKERNGYLRVMLWKDGIGKHYSVHRLVAINFIPNPKNLPVVNHKDRNKENNCINNLEWCTQKYNVNYADAHKKTVEAFKRANANRGITRKAQDTKNRLKSGAYERAVRQVDISTGEVLNTFRSISEARRMTRINHIHCVLSGRRKKAGGYFWELAE